MGTEFGDEYQGLEQEVVRVEAVVDGCHDFETRVLIDCS